VLGKASAGEVRVDYRLKDGAHKVVAERLDRQDVEVTREARAGGKLAATVRSHCTDDYEIFDLELVIAGFVVGQAVID